MVTKAFVLLSGGIDSSTCLHIACDDHVLVEGISVNYGQRHMKEVRYAGWQCEKLHLRHSIIDLRSVVPRTLLTDPSRNLPNKSYDEIEGVSPTYVPFRNGLMLSALASYASGQRRDEDDVSEWFIYFGAHAEDAKNWAYPDCTPEFIGAMANAIHVGTYRSIRLVTPLEWMTKDEIIRVGTKMGVDWQLTWSCYNGGDKHCGTCPTCRARKQAFVLADVLDPTDYTA